MTGADWKTIVAQADHPIWRGVNNVILFMAVVLITANNPDWSEVAEGSKFAAAYTAFELIKTKLKPKSD